MSGGSAGTSGSAGTGGSSSVALEVQAVANQALCADQTYDIELSASGGVAPYTWVLAQADIAAGTSLSATSGAVVHATGVAGASQPDLQLTVHDTAGATVTQKVTLQMLAVGQGLCPAINPENLAPACIAHDYYAANIVVSGGTAPFTWTALSLPDGLVFNAATQVLTGTALAASATTPLTLQVTDTLGRQTQRTYPLTFRDKCWLGFTSTEAGDSKVHLFDPAFSTRAPLLEAAAENTGVVDFKFSPDGNSLAYRRSSNGGPQDLVLAKAPTWQGQVLNFGGSVLEYSWSPSSTTLAVAVLDNTGNTQLGAFSLAASSVLTPTMVFDSTAAPLDSELLWFNAAPFDYVAFHGDAFPGGGTGLEYPYYAQLGGTGFSPVTFWDNELYSNTGDPQLEMQLQTAQRGIFIANPAAVQLDFFGPASSTDTDYYLRGSTVDGVFDPAGQYVAVIANDKLQILMTAESGGATDQPTAWGPSSDDCASIMGWDPSQERIACDARVSVNNTPPTGEVRMFDLAGYGSSPQLTMRAVKNLSGYQQGSSIGHPRSFSAGGSWFAFTTDSALYVADVRQAPQMQQRLLTPVGALASDPGALAFSPDETLLLWQVADQLAIVVLQTNGSSGWFPTQVGLGEPDPCQESFVTSPAVWCGKPNRTHSPVWAPDSRYAAVAAVGHAVRIYDFGRYLSGASIASVNACETGCSGDFAFQP
jgi:WD40 repeat protein